MGERAAGEEKHDNGQDMERQFSHDKPPWLKKKGKQPQITLSPPERQWSARIVGLPIDTFNLVTASNSLLAFRGATSLQAKEECRWEGLAGLARGEAGASPWRLEGHPPFAEA
jgi:hypothetical protein